MSKEKKPVTTDGETIETVDAETAEAEVEETAEVAPEKEETEVETEAETEDEVKADKSPDIDYDKELEAEKVRGKPDPAKAQAAFLERERKRKEAEDGDDDKPLTRKDLAEIEAKVRRETLAGQALGIAKTFTGVHANSDKEAALVVARWSNRTFPEGMPIVEQLEEVYAGLPHIRRKLMGERAEAVRALKAKDGVVRNAAGAHREGAPGKEPKLAPQDAAAIKAAGFAYNGVSRRFEKKLPDGSTLVRDPKTAATTRIPKK